MTSVTQEFGIYRSVSSWVCKAFQTTGTAARKVSSCWPW